MNIVKDKVAELKGIPTRTALMEQLENEVLEVTFLKINGDKRVMTCTLQEGVVPEATKTDTISQKKVQKINEEVQVVWDLNAKGWRSFRWANVTEVASV